MRSKEERYEDSGCEVGSLTCRKIFRKYCSRFRVTVARSFKLDVQNLMDSVKGGR